MVMIAVLFEESSKGFGVLMAATLGVSLYACGGTIPFFLMQLNNGMSMGIIAAFMLLASL